MEKKLFTLDNVKFAASDDSTKTFTGYGAVFDNVDSYGDKIVKGAFKAAIKSATKPLMFLNHDLYSLPIGKWTDLEEDDTGLKMAGEFIDTTAGRDAYTASKSGAITGLSIGFRPLDVEYTKSNSSEEPRRIIKSVDLLEVSVVTFPANGKARIGDVKSLQSDEDYVRELIRLGMDREEAKGFFESIQSQCEHKYNQAADAVAARKLLSKLLGDS